MMMKMMMMMVMTTMTMITLSMQTAEAVPCFGFQIVDANASFQLSAPQSPDTDCAMLIVSPDPVAQPLVSFLVDFVTLDGTCGGCSCNSLSLGDRTVCSTTSPFINLEKPFQWVRLFASEAANRSLVSFNATLKFLPGGVFFVV